MSTDIKTLPRDPDSRAYANAWRRAGPELEKERLRALRLLSEEEAAQRFASLLSSTESYPLRSGSGLVEQQRIFLLLRDREL